MTKEYTDNQANNEVELPAATYAESLEKLSAHELISRQGDKSQDSSGFRGEIRKEERRNASLNIVQNVGALRQEFNPGAIVLNKEKEISDGKAPVELTVLYVHKFYQQIVPFNSGIRPEIFETAAEVKKAGGTLEWKNGVAPTYQSVLRCTVLIKRPEGIDGGFPLNHEGEQYTTADWYLRGVSYKNAGATILNTILQLRHSKEPIRSVKWELCSQLWTSPKGFKSIIPALKEVGKHPASFQNFTAALID